MKLVILTYNIWFSDILINERLNSLINLINDTVPDILCFQEVRLDVLAVAVNKLTDKYKYWNECYHAKHIFSEGLNNKILLTHCNVVGEEITEVTNKIGTANSKFYTQFVPFTKLIQQARCVNKKKYHQGKIEDNLSNRNLLEFWPDQEGNVYTKQDKCEDKPCWEYKINSAADAEKMAKQDVDLCKKYLTPGSVNFGNIDISINIVRKKQKNIIHNYINDECRFYKNNRKYNE